MGRTVPSFIGVDVHVHEDAMLDPDRGIYLADIRDRSLASVLEAPVDLVIVKYVLHHMSVAARETVMNELAEVLVPGGWVLVLEASVGTDAADLASFEGCLGSHPAWPTGDWVEPYRAWSRRFYQSEAPVQRMLMCLEDTFGHVFLPGPEAGTPMPLPYTYVDRSTVTQLATEAGLEPDPELCAVLGLPPSLKYGPPSSLLAFRRPPGSG